MIRNSNWIGLSLGVLLGIGLLYAVKPQGLGEEKRYEELALGGATSTSLGIVNGVQVHCHDLDDMDVCLDGYASQGLNQPVVLWLGNSQVHAINQFSSGEETAAPDLHRMLRNQGRYFLTLSQPNANLQEHYALFAHLLGRLPIKTLVLPVVFDDMREDGLRASLDGVLEDAATNDLLQKKAIGRKLLAKHGDQDTAGNDMAALDETVQERTEEYLNETLARVWPLWAQRPDFRGEFFLSLYLLRNWALGIDPTSTRKMIPGRYAQNLDALVALLDLAAARGIAALVYVVPLRSDVKVPYDLAEYAAFKQEVTGLASRSSARFADLENLVPADLWGAKAATTVGGGEELDFMHFQAGGHRLLAAALYAELAALWADGAAP